MIVGQHDNTKGVLGGDLRDLAEDHPTRGGNVGEGKTTFEDNTLLSLSSNV